MAITFSDGNPAGTFALYCNGEARQLILSSKMNRVRVVRRADGYYAQFCLDRERREQGEYTGKVVGLDLGLCHFYTDQKGNTVDCPQFLRRAEKRLQRKLSRRFDKGAERQSNNYHKLRKRVAKVHLKVQRQRRDWVIKLARCVVVSSDIVAYEDLAVKNGEESGEEPPSGQVYPGCSLVCVHPLAGLLRQGVWQGGDCRSAGVQHAGVFWVWVPGEEDAFHSYPPVSGVWSGNLSRPECCAQHFAPSTKDVGT